MAMTQVVAPAGCQTVLALCRDIDCIKVEIAHERDSLAIRADVGKLLAARLVRQSNRCRQVEGCVVQVLRVLEQEAAVGWIHVERHGSGDRLRRIRVDRRDPRQALPQCLGIHEGLRAARCGVHLHEPPIPDLQPVLVVDPLLGAAETRRRDHPDAYRLRVDRM